MKLTNISILISELDLLEILKQFLISKNVFIKEINISDGIQFKNVSYKIFKNINLGFNVLKVIDNKIYIKISKLKVKGISVPKHIIDLVLKILPQNILKENKLDKHSFIIDLQKILDNQNFGFDLDKVLLKKGFAYIDILNIWINIKNKEIKKVNKGGVFLRLTQTTLRLSGEDIMSFVRDFIKGGNFSISGIDISQAIYLKGIIANSFEVGDVSINIKDIKENLLYVQIKLINSIFPGVNIEHIPIKIFVKDLLSAFSNLNLDLDVNSVRFIDDCIEVKINNFNLDMRKLGSGVNSTFLK